MKLKRFNWQIWAALVLSIFAVISYPVVFVKWPVTRDFPWVNLLLFGIAMVLTIVGLRRAFAGDRSRVAKVGAAVAAGLSTLVLGLFVFGFFVASRWLPAAQAAPHIGQKAPGFALVDTTGKSVSLAELTATPLNGKAPRGVLLIFYRGYW